MTNLKYILSARISYLHLIIGVVLSGILTILLKIAFIFLFWMVYGEGESSGHHKLSEIIFLLVPITLSVGILIVLIYKNTTTKNFNYSKSYLITDMLISTAYFYFIDIFLS